MEALPTPILVLSQGLRCSPGSMTSEQECQGRASPCTHRKPGKNFKTFMPLALLRCWQIWALCLQLCRCYCALKLPSVNMQYMRVALVA